MTTKGAKLNGKRDKIEVDATSKADFLTGLISGEFTDIQPQLAANIGTIAGLAISGGGYFGLSVSDDGVSAKLVIHRGNLQTDRRFYRIADLEAALAKCLTVLKL